MIDMQCGDIVFVKGKGIISWLIRFFDHGKWSHCAIVVNDKDDILEAQYPMKSQIVPFYFTDYEIVNLKISEEQRQRVQELAPSLEGHSYDYIQILSYLIKDTIDKKFKIINSPTNYVCSELVEIILQDINAIPKDKKLRDLSPNELFRYLKTIK